MRAGTSNPLDYNPLGTPRNINPMRAMPAQQFDRSIDEIQGSQPVGASGGGAPTDFTPPLWLMMAGTASVRVVFGQVSGDTPTGVNTPIVIGGTDATWSIYMHVDLGGDGVPTAVEVLSGTSGVPADDFENAFRLIGEADVSGGVITAVRPSMAWSQEFVTCGRDPEDPETTPGTYFWQVA